MRRLGAGTSLPDLREGVRDAHAQELSPGEAPFVRHVSAPAAHLPQVQEVDGDVSSDKGEDPSIKDEASSSKEDAAKRFL